MFWRNYHPSIHPNFHFSDRNLWLAKGLFVIVFLIMVGYIGYVSGGNQEALNILNATMQYAPGSDLQSQADANRLPVRIPEGNYFLQGFIQNFETDAGGAMKEGASALVPLRIPVSVDSSGNITCRTCISSSVQLDKAVASGRTIALKVNSTSNTFVLYGDLRRLPINGDRLAFTVSAGGSKGEHAAHMDALLYPR